MAIAGLLPAAWLSESLDVAVQDPAAASTTGRRHRGQPSFADGFGGELAPADLTTSPDVGSEPLSTHAQHASARVSGSGSVNVSFNGGQRSNLVRASQPDTPTLGRFPGMQQSSEGGAAASGTASQSGESVVRHDSASPEGSGRGRSAYRGRGRPVAEAPEPLAHGSLPPDMAVPGQGRQHDVSRRDAGPVAESGDGASAGASVGASDDLGPPRASDSALGPPRTRTTGLLQLPTAAEAGADVQERQGSGMSAASGLAPLPAPQPPAAAPAARDPLSSSVDLGQMQASTASGFKAPAPYRALRPPGLDIARSEAGSLAQSHALFTTHHGADHAAPFQAITNDINVVEADQHMVAEEHEAEEAADPKHRKSTPGATSNAPEKWWLTQACFCHCHRRMCKAELLSNGRYSHYRGVCFGLV